MTEQYREEWITDPNKLKANRFQPMRNQDADTYVAFLMDIATRGIRYPIYVDQNYYIINGHQRHRAWIELLENDTADIGPVKVVITERTAEEAMSDAYKDNLMQRKISKDELDAQIVQYIRDRQTWYSQRGYTGERKGHSSKYDWSQHGVISDGNNAVAEVFGVGADRVRKLRRRAEADGIVEPAVVLVGANGARLRDEAEKSVERMRQSADASGTRVVPTFLFPLPDGKELTAASQQELDDKVAAYMREQHEMYRQSIEDRDLLKKEIEKEYEEANERLRREYEEDVEKDKEEWAKKFADFMAKYQIEPNRKLFDIPEDIDLNELAKALDISKQERMHKSLELAGSIRGSAGMLRTNAHGGEEVARAVLEEAMDPRNYAESLSFLLQWISESLETMKQASGGLHAVPSPANNNGEAK
jgi:hypothetical protein